MRLIILFLAILFVSACSPNYWRCAYGNPSNWDSNTLEFCKYYRQGTANF